MMDFKSVSDSKLPSKDLLGLGPALSSADGKSDPAEPAVDGADESFADILGASNDENGSAGLVQPSLKDFDEALTKNLKDLDETVSQVGREIAMGTFLAKMKDTYQVEPEKLISAFAKLSPQDLQKPPEDNVEKIIAQLNIPQDQKPQVMEEFTKVLKVTEGPLGKPKASVEAESLPLALQLQIAQVQQMLAPVPQRPVSLKTPVADGEPGEDAIASTADSDSRERATVLASLYSALGNSSEVSSPSAGAGGAMSAPTGALTPAQYQQLAALVNPDASTVDSEPEPSTPSQPANEKPAPSVAPMSNDGAMVIPPALLAAQATAVAEARPAMPAANKQAGDRAYKPENRSTDSVSEAESGDKANANVATVAGQDGEAVAQTQAMTPAPKAALSGAAGSTGAVLQSNVPSKNNINEVIQQAQFLARKGGGEMKIQLQPEGLGQVSMHVRVDSGQVSIQMLTQNNDAKKMLEHSLSDLKSNLMSHQLELGAIKVDLAKDSARHFDQNDPSRRQAAQQGWDDFRQGQQQRKEFAEVSNPQQRSGPRLRAREFVQPPYMRAQRSGADRRLDLVA